MNFLVVVTFVSFLSGISMGSVRRPSAVCLKKFPPTGEPEWVEFKVMDNLIKTLRRETLEKFNAYETEIKSLKSLNKVCLDNEADFNKEIEHLKSQLVSQNEEIQELFGLLDQDGTANISDASKKGSFAGVQYWYRQDPSLIHKKDANYHNMTALHYASVKGHLAIVQFLLSKGADIEAGDSMNNTPLMVASYEGHVPIAEILLDKGADINRQNNYKWTPLHYSVANNHLSVVKVLINRGADRSLTDYLNQTPLDLARRRGFESIVDYLL